MTTKSSEFEEEEEKISEIIGDKFLMHVIVMKICTVYVIDVFDI